MEAEVTEEEDAVKLSTLKVEWKTSSSSLWLVSSQKHAVHISQSYTLLQKFDCILYAVEPLPIYIILVKIRTNLKKAEQHTLELGDKLINWIICFKLIQKTAEWKHQNFLYVSCKVRIATECFVKEGLTYSCTQNIIHAQTIMCQWSVIMPTRIPTEMEILVFGRIAQPKYKHARKMTVVNLNIPRMMFSSLGSRVRTGGISKWSIDWSSQIMLSSQRPYTSSSLSMGKMENQGQSSSWEAVEEQTKPTQWQTSQV